MDTSITITLTEFIFSFLPWFFVGFFFVRIQSQFKTIDSRIFGAIALTGIALFSKLTIKFLAASGYDEELAQTSILLFWLGIPVIFMYMSITEWRYSMALFREKASPITGFENRPDNIQRSKDDTLAYARDRKIVSTVSLVTSLLWLLLGSVFYFA